MSTGKVYIVQATMCILWVIQGRQEAGNCGAKGQRLRKQWRLLCRHPKPKPGSRSSRRFSIWKKLEQRLQCGYKSQTPHIADLSTVQFPPTTNHHSGLKHDYSWLHQDKPRWVIAREEVQWSTRSGWCFESSVELLRKKTDFIDDITVLQILILSVRASSCIFRCKSISGTYPGESVGQYVADTFTVQVSLDRYRASIDHRMSIPDICHRYHRLYMWRKICHVEKFQISLYDKFLHMTDVVKSDIYPHLSCASCRECIHVTHNLCCFVAIHVVFLPNYCCLNLRRFVTKYVLSRFTLFREEKNSSVPFLVFPCTFTFLQVWAPQLTLG